MKLHSLLENLKPGRVKVPPGPTPEEKARFKQRVKELNKQVDDHVSAYRKKHGLEDDKDWEDAKTKSMVKHYAKKGHTEGD